MSSRGSEVLFALSVAYLPKYSTKSGEPLSSVVKLTNIDHEHAGRLLSVQRAREKRDPLAPRSPYVAMALFLGALVGTGEKRR